MQITIIKLLEDIPWTNSHHPPLDILFTQMLVMITIASDKLVDIGQRGLKAVNGRVYPQAQSSISFIGLISMAIAQRVVL
jgi:hypothetical protein